MQYVARQAHIDRPHRPLPIHPCIRPSVYVSAVFPELPFDASSVNPVSEDEEGKPMPRRRSRSRSEIMMMMGREKRRSLIKFPKSPCVSQRERPC